MPILEREQDGKYTAWAIVDGVKYQQDYFRDPYSGWPYNYKVRAHNAIMAAIGKRNEKT